jgi:hypothetical protein
MMGALDDIFATANAAGDEERPSFLDKKPKGSIADILETANADVKQDRIGEANARAREATAGIEADKKTVMHDQAAATGAGGAFMNGVANATRFGFGDELEGLANRARDVIAGRRGPSYSQYRDTVRDADATIRANHPVANMAGETAGSLAIPSAAGASGAGRLGTTLVAGAEGALAGAGNSTADTPLGVARDAAVSGALSAGLSHAVGSIVRRAPERVDERMLANIARGEAGGAAKPKLYQNLVTKAGEEAAELNETLANYPGLKETLVSTAAAKPKVGVVKTERILTALNDEATPIYRAIDAGPAAPKAKQLFDRVLSMRAAMVEKGRTDIADALETFENHLTKHFGDGDAVHDGAVLNASMLREMRKGIGQIAFKDIANANTPTGTEAKRMIYGAINDVINEAAQKTPGVDASRLQQLNRDMSQLIAVKDVLADRSVKAAAGRTSLFQNILAGTAGGGAIAAATHDPVGAALGAVGAMAAVKGARMVANGGRKADFALAQLVSAARKGSTPAQLGQMAVELGLSRAMADQIASRGIGALSGRQSQGDTDLPATVEVQTTKLSPAEETSYQRWKATLPERLQYEGDYDLRGFYKKNPGWSPDAPEAHMTDEFKLPNHKTFSDESRYYDAKTKHLGGHWEGNVYVPNDTRFKERVDES